MADIKSSPGDPVFFMHHTYIDRVWWLWQKLDPINRLYDISGPSVNESANAEPIGGWQNTTLHYVLSSDEILPNVTVGEVMNPQSGYLCYGYE
jgi:tyrosinase